MLQIKHVLAWTMVLSTGSALASPLAAQSFDYASGKTSPEAFVY